MAEEITLETRVSEILQRKGGKKVEEILTVRVLGRLRGLHKIFRTLGYLLALSNFGPDSCQKILKRLNSLPEKEGKVAVA